MVMLMLGIFGLIVGSFLNVLILRKGIRSIGGRSSCMSCGHPLAAHDLVPVFSWLYLRGRCRYCGSRISAQYPLVEACTALIYAMIGGAGLSPVALFLGCLIAALLVLIAAYDILHTIIPDEWAYAFAGLGFLFAVFSPYSTFHIPSSLLAGPIAALPLFLLWLISSGRWMGLGDAKLALGIGWLLGFPTGAIAIMSSFVLGTLILVPWMLLQQAITHMRSLGQSAAGLTMKSEVPFGPFLIASCLIFWLSGLYGVVPPPGLFGLHWMSL